MTVKCIECNTHNGVLRYKLKKNICNGCYRLDKYTLITKTNSKKIDSINPLKK
jgi:hypothetical protein